MLTVAACAPELPLVDVERDQIWTWVNAYCNAAVRLKRHAGEAAPIERELASRLQSLRKVYAHPDGFRVVNETIAQKRATSAARAEELGVTELSLRGDARPSEIGAIVRERYDCELTVLALEDLSTALAK